MYLTRLLGSRAVQSRNKLQKVFTVTSEFRRMRKEFIVLL